VYRTIERLCPGVVDRADATAVQAFSVMHRTRYAEALELGLDSLRELGITVPAADRLPAELDRRFGYLYQWLDHTEAADDLARPDLTDPALLAACGLINATLTAAFFLGDPAMLTWLGLVTQAMLLSNIRDQVPAGVRGAVDEVRDELAATRQELRNLCQGVHPAILVDAGLGAAVRALARRSPLPVRAQVRTQGRLPGSCEVTAYYVAAEAFTNAAKHASASAVDILIEEAGGTLTVQVRDDGPAAPARAAARA
jgi:hypothetical protein